MSNVCLPPKFIIYPSKLPPAVACVKMTRHQFEGWKWVRGTQAAAAKLYYYFLEMGSSLILLITAETKRNQNMLPNQHKRQVTEASWHVWHAAFIKLAEPGRWWYWWYWHITSASVAGDGWLWCRAQPWHSSRICNFIFPWEFAC